MFKREREKYTLYGALFGLTFPIIATLMELGVDGLAVTLENIIFVQRASPLLWIIDSAPLFLGIFARFGGMQLDTVKDRARQLKTNNEQLAQLAEEAQAANRAKSDFLSNMSHEIRTPMNAILGLSYLILKSDSLADDHRRHLESVQRSASSLLRIINDILDHSKIEAGKLTIESSAFDLEPLLQTVVDQANVKLAKKPDVELQLRIDESLPTTVMGDSLRLQQVLTNLVDNAIKFTDHGEVRLSASSKQSGDRYRLFISVEDQGIGMSHNQLDTLFQPFTQADYSTTRKYGGTGLGLSIVKNLVELMGGEISVSSVPGSGTTFTFTVDVGTTSSAARILPREKTFNKRVLIIDDSPTSLDILHDMLAGMGFNVELAKSGEEATIRFHEAILDNAPFELILVDWRMPNLNGIETIKVLRRDYPDHVPTIVMVTAYGQAEVMEQAESIGADGFLVKPVNPSLMYDTLVNIFGETVLQESTTKAEQPREIDTTALAGMHVLVVEDNEINQQVAIELLKMVGVKADVAENGVIAVDRMSTNEYDVVLMDIQMPVMDGLTAAKQARENGYTRPILAMTAHAMTGERDKSLEAGMNDHLTKPVDPEALYRALYVYGVHRTDADPMEIVAEEPTSIEITDDMIESIVASVRGYDLEGALARCVGNRGLLQSLIWQFASQQQDMPDLLRQDPESMDRDRVRARVHNLKGVAGNLGFKHLAKTATSVEQALQFTEHDVTRKGLTQLIAELSPILETIGAFRPSGHHAHDTSAMVDERDAKTEITQIIEGIEAGDPSAIARLDRLFSIVDKDIHQELEDAETSAKNWDPDNAITILRRVYERL